MAIKIPSVSSVGTSIKNAGTNLVKSVKSQIKDLTSVYSNYKDPTKGYPADTFFPDYLNDANGKYPCIRFSTYSDPEEGKKLFSIYLPCPANITFSDSGTYDQNVNLGIIGGAQADIMRAAGSGNFLATAGEKIGQVMSLKLSEALAIASEEISPELQDKILFAQRKIKAPNQVAQFRGNEPRSFNFSFTAVVRSESESNAIHNIHRIFRRYTYAGADKGAVNIILSYPPVWKIDFLLDGGLNGKLPKIYGCYLSSIETNFNSGQSSFMTDGSPQQVDISLTFKETRTLNRLDIDNLEKGTSDREFKNPYT